MKGKMKDFQYKTSFSFTIKPLISEEKDKYLALASLIQIGNFIPDIDTDKNVDLLPVAFNACVVNRVNKNGDVIDAETALAIYKNFINKPINIEHNRGRVIGVVLTAGFSEFGTDNPLSEEEVKNLSGPFNITLGGVIWRVTNENLASLIEDSSDPSSDNYLRVSASWELGFSDFFIVKISENSKNIEDGEIISDEENIEKIKNNLKSYGGTGKIGDDYVYRLVAGSVVPLGIGLTESPAADVKGIAITKCDDVLQKTKYTEDEEKISSSSVLKENLFIPENKSSQKDETNVINDEIYNNKIIVNTMKITSLSDITNETLRTVEASVVSDFIESELKKKCEEHDVEKAQFQNVIEESKKNLEIASSDNENLKSEIDVLRKKIEEIEALQALQEAEAKFNERMAAFDEEYHLDDEVRKLIAEQLKNMPLEDDSETYAAWHKNSKIYLKRHSKSFVSTQEEVSITEEAKEEVCEKAQAKEIAASTSEADAVVEEAIENAEKEVGEIPNTSSASEPTVLEKYQAAFNLDQFEIKY